MKELVVYFYDDVVNILYHNKVISRKLSSVRQGLVVDRTSFMESFLSILKKEKIKSKLFGDKIYIVQDVYFNSRDLFFLENMFIDMGFIKVLYIDIQDLFAEDYTFIGLFKDYMVFYLDKPVWIDLAYFKDFPKLIDYFKDYYQKYIVLFGSNEFIPKIQSKLVNIYYIDDSKNYIIKSLLKVKKCDA